MSKKTLQVVLEPQEELLHSLGLPRFQPSLDQIAFKSEVLSKLKNGEKVSFSTRKLSALVGGTPTKSTVARWMAIPGFKEWLGDNRDAKTLGESLIPEVVKELYETVKSGIDTAKVAAARTLMEFYSQKPVNRNLNVEGEIKDLSDDEMDKQIEELLKK